MEALRLRKVMCACRADVGAGLVLRPQSIAYSTSPGPFRQCILQRRRETELSIISRDSGVGSVPAWTRSPLARCEYTLSAEASANRSAFFTESGPFRVDVDLVRVRVRIVDVEPQYEP